MPRQFIEIKLWPYRAPAPTPCVKCSQRVREGEQAQRRRATVTATAVIEDGSELKVAYCGKHVPSELKDQIAEQSPGSGAVVCQGCGQPTRDHSLLDNCMTPLIP